MKHLIVTVGKPRLAYAGAGVEEYLTRLQHYGSFEWKQVKAGLRDEEGKRLLAVSGGFHRIVLDERGKQVATRELAKKFEHWEMSAVKGLAFLIGGADGHVDAVRMSADWVWSLSPLTLQHELALIVLLEQLYRVQTLRRGEPYHRDS